MQFYNTWYSFLQIRGSVPLFWTQTGSSAVVQISRSRELTNAVYCKHVDNMLANYGHITFINLLQNSRTYEKILTD
jgi:hypothetical protein